MSSSSKQEDHNLAVLGSLRAFAIAKKVRYDIFGSKSKEAERKRKTAGQIDRIGKQDKMEEKAKTAAQTRKNQIESAIKI